MKFHAVKAIYERSLFTNSGYYCGENGTFANCKSLVII